MTYEQARQELLEAELTLMQQRETVAAMRRELPAGPLVGEYRFTTSDGEVTLDALVGDRPLVLYHFMFGGPMLEPCPMCSMWADGWNAVRHHVDANVDFALATLASADDNADLASRRGWQDLTWLSATGTTFKTDFNSADAEGNQNPTVTVFERSDDGVRLSYAGSAHISGDHWRGLDLLSPVWHLLDLTRQGRGDFMPSLAYQS